MAVNNIPRSYQFIPSTAVTPPDFNLDAGKYGLLVTAGVFGTATLQRLLPDGVNANYVPVSAAIAAVGYTVVELPAGQYRLVLAGMTAFVGLIEQIAPGRQGG